MNFAIIAAGEGSRLASEGIKDPKPLVQINGEALIDRLIRIFLDNHAESISIICNDLTHRVSAHLEHIKEHGLNDRKVPLNYMVKTTPSSMHSLWHLSKLMPQGPFVLTTVDTIFSEQQFARYIEAFQQSLAKGYDALMGVTPFVDDEKPLYVGTDPELNITGYYDTQTNPPCQYISAGIYALTANVQPVLNHCVQQGESRMRNFQRALVAQGLRLKAFNFGKVMDVDHASDIAKAEAFINETHA